MCYLVIWGYTLPQVDYWSARSLALAWRPALRLPFWEWPAGCVTFTGLALVCRFGGLPLAGLGCAGAFGRRVVILVRANGWKVSRIKESIIRATWCSPECGPDELEQKRKRVKSETYVTLHILHILLNVQRGAFLYRLLIKHASLRRGALFCYGLLLFPCLFKQKMCRKIGKNTVKRIVSVWTFSPFQKSSFFSLSFFLLTVCFPMYIFLKKKKKEVRPN